MLASKADEERVFLVTEELEFRPGETDGEPTFIWRDLQGDVDELFEFVCPDTNAPTRAFFETCMYRAMYERKYKRNADAATEGALEEFVYRAPAKKAAPKARSKATLTNNPASSSSSHPNDAIPVELEEDKPPVPPGQAEMAHRESLGLTPINLPGARSIISIEARFYRWNFEIEEFDNNGIVNAQILKNSDSSYEYYLVAATSAGPLLAHEISSDMNQRCSRKMKTLTWNYVSAANHQSSWLFMFDSEEDYQAFIQAFNSCLYESLNQTPWARVKVRMNSLA